MEVTPKIICLTPIKNEAWILDKFLTYTSLWADHIIIADQMSTDGSREIARKYEKVILVDNTSEAFNESERQKLLINEARKIEGPRLLITLDADEFFTPNFESSPEWETMLKAKPGTVVKFRLIDLHANFRHMTIDILYPWGYLDDGYDHKGRKIHSERIPMNPEGDVLILNSIHVLHFADTNPNRNLRKYNWYQCYERVSFPNKSSIDIARIYNRLYVNKHGNYVDIPKEWFEAFTALGIDITSTKEEALYWWDEEVLNYFDRYGTSYFKRENIWKTDWCHIAQMLNRESIEKYREPRSKFYKKIRTYLVISQRYREKLHIRLIDKLLKYFVKY